MVFSYDVSFAVSSAVPVHPQTMEGRLLGRLPWEGTEAVSPRENSLPDLSPYYRNAWRPTKLFLL